MLGLGIQELVIILVIVLVIFGAGKIPDLGSGIGKGIKNFKKGIQDGESLEEGENKAKKSSIEEK
jgi:sec-independent protein translocase protein TatA